MTRTARAGARRLLAATVALAIFGAGAAIAWPVDEASSNAATMCDSLDAVPITFAIDYQAIQFIFDNNRCTDCHTTAKGVVPPFGLDLEPGISWTKLVNVPSGQDGTLIRVVPNRPDISLLFHKVNCFAPDVGNRMPLGGPYMTPEDQALIYDWIAAGAPVGSTDTLFRAGFDPRG